MFDVLAGIASRTRLGKSIAFLLREGYLRRDQGGNIVEDAPLHAVDPQIPTSKIRAFHRAALRIASGALDRYPTHRR